MNKDKMKLEEAVQILRDIQKFWINYDYATEEGKKSLIENSEAIETVLQALEEVTEERNDYRSQLNGVFDNGFIPKNKIEDKKQWLEENILENDYANDFDKDIAEYQVNILGELLDDK